MPFNVGQAAGMMKQGMNRLKPNKNIPGMRQANQAMGGLGKGIAPSSGGMMNAMRSMPGVNKLGNQMGQMGARAGAGMNQMGNAMGAAFGQGGPPQQQMQPPMAQQLPYGSSMQNDQMMQSEPPPQMMQDQSPNPMQQALAAYGPKNSALMQNPQQNRWQQVMQRGGIGPRFM